MNVLLCCKQQIKAAVNFTAATISEESSHVFDSLCIRAEQCCKLISLDKTFVCFSCFNPERLATVWSMFSVDKTLPVIAIYF